MAVDLKKINELKEKRAKCIADMRALTEKAVTENRAADATENEAYAKLDAKQGELKGTIDRLDAELKLDQEMRAANPPPAGTVVRKGNGETETAVSEPDRKAEDEAHLKAFRSYIKRGRDISAEESRMLVTVPERRGLISGDDTQGGYIVPPEEYVNKLIIRVTDLVFLRAAATVLTVKGVRSIGFPTLEKDPTDPVWTSELSIGPEDTQMAFGKRQMTPHKLSKMVKVSNELLMSAAMDVEQLLRDRFGIRFAAAEENAFMFGDGASKPLGLFTPSPMGVPTTRDFVCGGTATTIDFDGLIACKFELKPQYWANARWIFHRYALKMLMLIKDTTGRYIYQPSLVAGSPDRLLDLPFDLSEYAPHTYTASLYAGMLGDFSYYYILDSLSMTFQRLMELYAVTDQIGFIMREYVDGAPVLDEAFVRLKMHA